MAHQHHHNPHQPTVAMDEATDSWHMHTSAEGLPQEEHGATAQAGALIASFAGSVIFVGAVILVTILYYRQHVTMLRRERIETTDFYREVYTPYRQQSDKALTGYGWAGPEAAAAGQVSIPIDIAMQRVLQNYGNGGAK